jgi:hypothetical protein
MGDIGLLSSQTVAELIHQKFESPLPVVHDLEDPLIKGESQKRRKKESADYCTWPGGSSDKGWVAKEEKERERWLLYLTWRILW